MTQGTVDYHVANAEQALSDAYSTISQILADTEAAVGRLQETWSGFSQTEYQDVQQRWVNDLQQMQATLGRYIGTFSQLAPSCSQDLVLPAPPGG
jgi:WXG100 family type VII secretion target